MFVNGNVSEVLFIGVIAATFEHFISSCPNLRKQNDSGSEQFAVLLLRQFRAEVNPSDAHMTVEVAVNWESF